MPYENTIANNIRSQLIKKSFLYLKDLFPGVLFRKKAGNTKKNAEIEIKKSVFAYGWSLCFSLVKRQKRLR